MRITIIYICILAFLCGCDRRLSPDEGEVFLQKMEAEYSVEGRKSDTAMSLDDLRSELLLADQTYRLTPQQQLKLKKLQLKSYYLMGGELNDQLCTEMESIARQLGNDSILYQTRQVIFTHYASLRDVAQAQELFNRMEPYALQTTNELHYRDCLTMARLYARVQQPEVCVDFINEAKKHVNTSSGTWYLQAGDASLDCGLYPEALAYADSALANTVFATTSTAHLVRGIALSRLGRTDEAYAWMQQCIQELRQFQAKHNIRTMSFVQYQLVAEYALSLVNKNNIREALPLLEEINELHPATSNINGSRYTLDEYKMRVLHALSTCYYRVGDQQKAIDYANRTDSLQRGMVQDRINIIREGISASSQKELLSSRLTLQEAKAAHTRLIQYVLVGIILILIGIITGGCLWWRNHRRRLRQLFDLLTTHHAAWLQIYYQDPSFSSATNHPTYALPVWEVASEINEPVSDEPEDMPETQYHYYQRILAIMKDQKPFLEPAFDQLTLCRLAGTNRTQLSAALNRMTGMNFSRWLAEYRVNYLLSLSALHPQEELNEFYVMAGFSSRTSFFRQFRQVTGLTPSQYNKERSETD